MGNIISTLIAVVVFVLSPSLVSAQGMQQGQGSDQQNIQEAVAGESEVVIPNGNQVQNQNQVQTQNQGEESQLQVATEHMEQLMDMNGLKEEVRSQVKTLAQEQVQAQTQIQTQLSKLESKPGLMKRLFGPDYGAIKNLKQQAEQNQLRIRQLNELQTQVVNQAEEIQIEEAVQALVEQNTVLQDQIQAEEQVSSLFGWLVKLLAN